MTTTPSQTFTQRLCERIVGLSSSSLDEPVRAHARTLVLDGIAVAVAGTRLEAPPGIVAGLVAEESARPAATVIGFGFKTSPARAAYVNGTAMHVLDYEPMWMPANHALSTTLPAALALAESTGASGDDLAVALIKGIEIQGWIREASGQWDPGALKFHPPGLVGPMSAAVAAGTLLRLDESAMRNALGIAASRCGSVLANAGTMTKSTHCGLAASLGLEAAQLAARGFDANEAVFDDPRGYPAAFFPEFDASRLLEFGPPYRVVQPSYAIKMYPSQFGTHFGITAGLELHRQLAARGLGAAAVRKARLITPHMPYVDRPKPESGLGGKFSWQYTFACALLDGQVTMSSFADERRFRSDADTLLQRIELDMRKEISGRFDECHVRAIITLEDGAELEACCEGPRGSWRGTPITPAEHLVKVRDCLRTHLDEDRCEGVIKLASRIDRLTPGELRGLLDALA